MADIFDIPLPSYAFTYINHLGVINRSPHTQKAYAQELFLFLKFICDYKPGFPPSPSSLTIGHLQQIQHTDVEAYLNWARTQRKNGVRALARKQAAIKSFYRYLLREDLILKDITIKLNPISQNQKAPKALEPEQIADLVDIIETGTGLSEGQLKYHLYTEKRDYAIFLTFIGTGLRLSELYGLNLQSIDFNKGCFAVIRKGNKETNIYFNTEVATAIQDYIKNERPRYMLQHTEALFLSIQGNRMSKRAIQDLIKKYMAILQNFGHNTEGYSAHKLRSTFATLLLRETENLAIVQDALGHSDPRTTRIYAKVLDEQLRRAADHIKFR
ncbi:tyrosine-type recombinase/integrase [Desulfitobacterium hafniense]|uniref:Recombinase XerC n=5 Tax=root TaxID=1 RepID=Q24X82_DESHY|nr:tyrosine-type recombinase/integrase [Desulfitobacterium hafniense]ACL20725.1 integrase family protein [Desulfitobacterium hafniense DCB-2]EHL07298.1 phage integrase, SAM-like domain protein [Desulfitobacterium hafniense DP7]KTE91007.1 recombinase XerD [Desulfitobacterium hafniense]MEA5024848.1 tyrosine-type recombinase/integrase [Desulfitobacterium hafniense]CDX01624.1 Phage integrase, N-terminal SAM-like domain [Desulfitobacterium hafniense]